MNCEPSNCDYKTENEELNTQVCILRNSWKRCLKEIEDLKKEIEHLKNQNSQCDDVISTLLNDNEQLQKSWDDLNELNIELKKQNRYVVYPHTEKILKDLDNLNHE